MSSTRFQLFNSSYLPVAHGVAVGNRQSKKPARGKQMLTRQYHRAEHVLLAIV